MLEYLRSVAVNAATLDERAESDRVGDRRVADNELPAWINTFAWVLEALQQLPPETSNPGFINFDRPIPFEGLFIPVVIRARKQRDDQINPSGLFSSHALNSLDRLLLGQLSDLCAVALFEAFLIFRHLRRPWILPLASSTAPNSCSLYHQFVENFRTHQAQDFFLQNSLLARFLATVVEQWIATTTELIQRLYVDRTGIAECFNDGNDLGVVEVIESSLSDPHQGGRMVSILTFTCGLKLVYKPKDMGIDVAWYEFLQWLEHQGTPYKLRAPKILIGSGHTSSSYTSSEYASSECASPGYGWAEFIPASPCATTSDIEGFFQKAGALLCLFYLLQGTDFHSENVIASADQPVAIDLETLMVPWNSPVFLQGGLGKISEVATAHFRDTVLATTYLPDWLVGQGDQHRAIGGLSPIRTCQVATFTFINVNTDTMQRVKQLSALPPPQNLPSLDGEYPSPVRFRDSIVAGFTAFYRFLVAHRHELLDPSGGIACFKGKIVRVVLRPTEHYALLQRRRTARPYLQTGMDWSNCLKFLSPVVINSNGLESLSATQVTAEQQALTRLDIPYFTALTDGLDLYSDGQSKIANYFTVSSFDQVVARIQGLNEPAMRRQIELIQDVITSTGSPQTAPPVAWVQLINSQTTDPQNIDSQNTDFQNIAFNSDRVIDQVSQFITLLEREAIWAEDAATWLGPVPLPGEQLHRLGLIGTDLYSGTSGIALFLAAFEAVTGESSKRKLTLAALTPLRQSLIDPLSGAQLLRKIGLGGATGLASTLYVLVKVGSLLDEPTLLEDALKAAALISDERIQADTSLDVIAGVAGTILALIALYQVMPEESLFEKLLLCGHHLLKHQVVLNNGDQAWRTYNQMPLTGFSHGTAGIVLALLRLYQISKEDAFLQAGLKGLQYERNMFSDVHNNWPDLRDTEQSNSPTFPCQWCHGAPGIGLTRIGIMQVLQDPQLQAEIEAAVETTIRFPMTAIDHLCCGNFGRLEFLFTAGHQLGKPDLMDLAQVRAAVLLDLATQGRNFGWQIGHDRRNPGFFTGFSGVGYTLLRFLAPEKLPSVLLWD